jgi:hypothetical protein
VPDLAEIENKAAICRTTCGWKKADLPLENVLRFWRDVHSPAISRRAGIYEYRHLQFAPVDASALPTVEGVDYSAPADEQLMWLSDVRYADQAGLDAFGASPPPEEKALMLADIEMIVHRSTTYVVLGENGKTYVDKNEMPPIGPAKLATYSLFVRARSSEPEFRAALSQIAAKWSANPAVDRLRLSLFEVPDMEAERKAGYPIKTHPLEMQYQAWIDITVTEPAALAALIDDETAALLSAHVTTLHAYPTNVVFTFVHDGFPTLIGLRGYAAYQAIHGLNAVQHQNSKLLSWMYGAKITREGIVQ